MIQTTRQLKDKIHNLSGGNSQKAQALLNYSFVIFCNSPSIRLFISTSPE